jgi:uncharacterized membrane protein
LSSSVFFFFFIVFNSIVVVVVVVFLFCDFKEGEKDDTKSRAVRERSLPVFREEKDASEGMDDISVNTLGVVVEK